MQSENDEFINASNDYYRRLNGVNLLLLKQHSLLLERKNYEEEMEQIDLLTAQLAPSPSHPPSSAPSQLPLEAEFDYLQKCIRSNKREIAQLRSKLEQKDSMINELTALTETRKKYEKLIDTEYQNGIQQKLSMIRGKVDDLKKKIKEINKDILSYEQEHGELIDEFSF
jgi:uncharacterized protein YlxW (UPF0749 family)